MSSTKSNDGYLELVKSKATDQPAPQKPRILKRIEDDTIEAFGQLVDHMFSAIDDLFYELSKRASSNNEENLYFESMRELRIKKGGLGKAFIRSITQNFTDMLQSGAELPGVEDDQQDEASLAIVEGDDLEIDIALKGMATRTRETFKSELYEIALRLDHLLLQVTVTEKNNALDPMQVTRAFVESCQDQLNINIKTRLIVFKLFEKHVLKQLGRVYADTNAQLIETGILPKISKSTRNTAARGTGAPATQNIPPAAEQIPEQLGNMHEQQNVSIDQSTIATIMAAFRKAQGSLYATPGKDGGTNNYYFYANNPGPVMNAPDLAKGLTNKQSSLDQELTKLSQPKNVLPNLISELLSSKNPKRPQALAQPEEDTINLVALFFDKVLEDENQPIAIQSLICRLQIPILKLALNDSTFLTDKTHPARLLINSITEIGLSVDETKPIEKDPLFQVLVDGVQTINKQYKMDSTVFEDVQKEIAKQQRKESKKSRVVEKRTTQTEEGKVKIKHARSFAQNALYEKIKDAPLHPKISEFLTNTWLQVLVITYLKDGKEGFAWVENEQLITDLVWLCQPHTDERSQARAQRIRPEVLGKIEKGLSSAIDNPDSRTSIINSIEEVLQTLICSDENATSDLQPLSQEQKAVLGKTGENEKSWEEMTALERQQTKYEELSSKFYQKAKDLPLETWIEYQDEQSGKLIRCKLSAKIDSESYIFVTRLGF